MSTQMLGMSPILVGTVLRLERDASLMAKCRRQATNEYPPPPLASISLWTPGLFLVVLPSYPRPGVSFGIDVLRLPATVPAAAFSAHWEQHNNVSELGNMINLSSDICIYLSALQTKWCRSRDDWVWSES